jgi:elongation factor Ts
LRAELSKVVGAEIQLTGFVRYERGEGIVKEADDFAAEATRMAEQPS